MDDLFHGVRRGEVILELRGITKRFPGVVANDKIDFEMRAGEIHAILGENGAGKTTLMKILYGIIQPDEGEIYIRGRRVRFHSPQDAIRMGIGMVHQNRKLVNAHTVLENIILGHPHAGRVLNRKRVRREIEALSRRYGFEIDLDATVWQLSEGQKQVVEILKALYRGARILILDEPTSALAPPEAESLLTSVATMAEDELAIIPFITHKLPHVLARSHRVTVLRRGKVTARLETAGVTEHQLAREMVGRDVDFTVERPVVPRGRPVLQVENLSALSNRGFLALRGVSFTVHEGEIFGIAGVSGNGQHELAEVLAGLRRPVGGRVYFDGRDITHASALARWRLGIGYIPAERNTVGSIADFSLVENVAMNYYFDDRFVRRGIMDYGYLANLTRDLIAEYDVATPGPEAKAGHLSGGNLQKLILARVLARHPRLIIANLPTQGLDVGATEFVQRQLLTAKKSGAAILLISEDLDEVLALSDVVAPIYEGEFMGMVPALELERGHIGAMMAGVRPGGRSA
jgi:ABC-type uncharacterized transport system ATPase subunit